MKLKFSNGAGDESEINIKGKCQITDYDPRTNAPGKNNLTVKVDGENASIMNGTELQQDSQTVTMNANKYSIFTAIAGMDGDNATLTQKDIEEAKKIFNSNNEDWKVLAELGVTQIRYDSHAGVATIVIGNSEVLRIDFQTWRERWGIQEDSSTVEGTEKLTKTEIQKPEIELYNNSLNTVVDLMNEKQTTMITKEQLNAKISEIANNVPCSELLVKYVMSTESFIRKAKKVGKNGIVTVGFGHTVNAINNRNFSAGFEISNDKAFQWLEQDIKDVIKKIKEIYLPDVNWDKVPQSIQDAIVDLTFNVGESIITSKNIGQILKEAEDSGSYADAAIKISKIESNIPDLKAGLMRRSCYRFFLAIEDLPAKERLKAMKSFSEGNNSYYSETLRLSDSNSATLLKDDWLEVLHTAEKELGLYVEPPGTKYVVKPGDSWWKIAHEHNISVDSLKNFNSPANKDLVIGQRIRIPELESTEQEQV